MTDESRKKLEEELRRKEVREEMRGALREWLDEKLAEFGLFTLKGIIAVILAFSAYLAVTQPFWTRFHGSP